MMQHSQGAFSENAMWVFGLASWEAIELTCADSASEEGELPKFELGASAPCYGVDSELFRRSCAR